MLLARAGLDVTILERLPTVGGRTSALEADGFRFDLGPTFFLFPLSLERIFRAVDRNLRAEVPMVRLDPQYQLIFGAGGELHATPNVARMEHEIASLCPDDAKQFRRFLSENREKLKQFQPVLERPFLNWRATVNWEMIKMLPLLRPWLSLDGELARYFRDPRVRLAFSFQSKYLGMSPFNCPSLFSILSFLEYEFGVWHPVGGCAAVSEGMARVARELGVTFSLGEDVTQLLFEGRHAVGVKTAVGEYRANALVINADFAHAMTKLVPIAAGLQKEATRNLSKQDLATLKRVLRKMHHNLTQERF
jgi:phytoene desaturase